MRAAASTQRAREVVQSLARYNFAAFLDQLEANHGQRESVKNLQNYRRRRAAEKGRTA